MEIQDIGGLGKACEKLLDVVTRTIGTLYRPTGMRREAAAKAEEVRLLGKATAEMEAERIRIVGLADAKNRLLVAETDQEIFERANARLVTREIQRQTNIENITQIAFEELPEEVSEEPVDNNWRVRFFNIAEDVADSEMQFLWGKILAGEVASPGRYSIRSLEVLRNLSRHEAELFQRACGLVFDGGWIAKLEDTASMPTMLISPPPPPHFAEFGLAYDHVLLLRAAGLVAEGDTLSSMFPIVGGSGQTGTQRILSYNNGIPLVFELDGATALQIPTVLFTPAGKELRSLIPLTPNLGYLRRVAEGLHLRRIEMYRAKNIDGIVHIDQRDEL